MNKKGYKYLIIVFLFLIILVGAIIMHRMLFRAYFIKKIGINLAVSCEEIIQKKGEPLSTEQQDDLIRMEYDGITYTFYQCSTGYKRFFTAEITSENYRYGLFSIGIGSSKEQVASAFKNCKPITGLDSNELGFIDGILRIYFDLDKNEEVSNIVVGFNL